MSSDSDYPVDLDALCDEGRALYDAVTADFDLSAHEIAQLIQACRMADRLSAIESEIASGPLLHTNRYGERVSSPLLSEARQTSLALSRILAALRVPAGDEDAQPQRRTGVRGVYAKKTA